MPRGGKRTPPARTPPGGPGQLSRRTDGQQIATPPLSGSPDIQSGDIGKLRATQRMMPLPAGVPEPRPAASMRRPTGAPSQGGAAENDVQHLFSMPDEVSEEPTTQGLAVGPGAGPEVLDASTPSPDAREQVLQALYVKFGNQEAFDMLQDIINSKAQQVNQSPTPMQGPPPPPGEEPDAALAGPSSVR